MWLDLAFGLQYCSQLRVEIMQGPALRQQDEAFGVRIHEDIVAGDSPTDGWRPQRPAEPTQGASG